MNKLNKHELITKLKALDNLTPDERGYLIELINKKKYGLVWEEKPEDVEEQLRRELPVLQEVPERRILGAELPKPETPKTETPNSDLFTEATPAQEQTDPDLQGPKNTTPEQYPNHILIEGDNLHALTALSFTHEGRIDVIYIDPPYNTGNKDFKYNDTFVDREDSFRHSKWLSFMHKRLEIAKRLLSEKGVIFISIDDNEQAQLKMLSDEVFGEINFIGNLAWEKGKKGDSKFISVSHEYILIYVKSKAVLLSENVRWRKKKPGVDEVLFAYEEIKKKNKADHLRIRKEMMEWYKSLPKTDVRKNHKHYNHSDNRGLYFPDNFAGPDDGRLNRPRYDILHPITGKPCAKPSTGWRWDESTTIKALNEIPARIHFGKDENTIPCRKSYLKEISSEPFGSVFYKDGRAATLEVEEIIGKGKFNFPKDTSIINQLINLNSSKTSTILDFFAGSGTTLHSTMQLNSEDGGNRKCILVTNNENNICEEVTYERNKRVIQGYTNAKGQQVPGLTQNNLRYYKTAFVQRETSIKNKRELTRLATELLCIKEDCYHECTQAITGSSQNWLSLFTNHQGRFVCIIYDDEQIEEGVEILQKLVQAEKPIFPVKVYVFSNGQYPYTEEFEDLLPHITLCALPDALYKAYQNVLPAKKARPLPEIEELTAQQVEESKTGKAEFTL
ncbi:MAG: site-specific DNA-methyltransferase, partial [Chitinophagaceae bacterium]